MQEFDNRGESDSAGAALPCRVSVTEKQQRGAQAFSTTAKQIAGQLGDWREGHRALAREFLFHEDQIFANEVKNLLGREQRYDILRIKFEKGSCHSGQY